MQTEINTALLVTQKGIAESLLVAWLIKCQAHVSYMLSNHTGVSHGFSGKGHPSKDPEQEAQITVDDFGATLQWFHEEELPARFVLNFFKHNRGDGLLREPDPHSYTFFLMDCPVTLETLEAMAHNLVSCTFRQYAFTSIPRLKDQVNHLSIVRGFEGVQPEQVQE